MIKLELDYWYFAEQYFLFPKSTTILEYYQTNDEFYFKWNNVNENFVMPLDILVNGKEIRVIPTKKYQSFKISKHSRN